MRNSYEQLIEYIINDDVEKAKELFHNIVVGKSRDLYNEIVAEEMEEEVEENFDYDMDEADDDMNGMSMDQTDDMMHDIEADHDGMDHEGSDDMDMDMDTDGDMDMGHEEGEGGMEDRVMDLEDALDELKAEFEKLMADEAGEEAHNDGKNDPDFAEEGVVREYVEKIGDAYKGEFGGNPRGAPVGAGTGEFIKTGETNPKSVVAGKNDMGGTAKNLNQGQKNEDPDGKAYRGPKNEYSKGEGKLPGSGQFLNAPGGDAGKKGFSNAKKPQSAEGKFATGGGPNVNKKPTTAR